MSFVSRTVHYTLLELNSFSIHYVEVEIDKSNEPASSQFKKIVKPHGNMAMGSAINTTASPEEANLINATSKAESPQELSIFVDDLLEQMVSLIDIGYTYFLVRRDNMIMCNSQARWYGCCFHPFMLLFFLIVNTINKFLWISQ